VHVFRASQPQTFQISELHAALHGQSFSTPEITDDLALNYPAPVPGFFNIGILHTNLSGISEHANYAPCSLDTLKNKGYQYWALGHVHNRQVLCSDPYIVFPGNIQGRHGKEPGEKSCELVTVSDAGAASLQTISTSVVPWSEVEIDASGCATADEVYERLRSRFEEVVAQAKERITAVRLLITGLTDVHAELNRDPEQVRNEVISLANECGGGLLWIERVRVATSPRLDRAAWLKRDDPFGEVLRILGSMRTDASSLSQLEAVEELRKKLPSGIGEGSDPIALDTPALAVALDEAEGLLLARLAATEAV
jgi:DNA repair exonuclease SbcCD nuclease subunit